MAQQSLTVGAIALGMDELCPSPVNPADLELLAEGDDLVVNAAGDSVPMDDVSAGERREEATASSTVAGEEPAMEVDPLPHFEVEPETAPETQTGLLKPVLVFSGPVNRDTGYIQCEDGETRFINPLLLGSVEESAVSVHMGHQNALFRALRASGCQETMPDEWFSNYFDMGVGMTQSAAFRDLVDTEIMEQIALVPDEMETEEEASETQSEVPKSSKSRVVDTTHPGLSKEQLVSAELRVRMKEAEMLQEQLKEKKAETKRRIEELARADLESLERINREKAALNSAKKVNDEQRKAVQKSIKDATSKMTKLEKGKGSGKGSSGKKPTSGSKPDRKRVRDSSVESASGRSSLPRVVKSETSSPKPTRKGKEISASNEEPVPVVIEPVVANGDEPMEEVATDEDEGSETGEMKLVWANALGKFQDWPPSSFEECAIGKKSYKAPPLVNCNADSDDEEWLRGSPSETSVNSCYREWIEYLDVCRDDYYSRDARYKVLWAASRYVARDNPWCPFQICEDRDGDSENPRRFRTAKRFQRHLVIEHCHHHPEYRCIANIRGGNGECKGLTTDYRGELVRHLNGIHHMAMPEGVERVNLLHDLLCTEWRATVRAGWTSQSYRLCLVKHKSMLEASFELRHMVNRITLRPKLMDLVRLYRDECEAAVGSRDDRVKKRIRGVSSDSSESGTPRSCSSGSANRVSSTGSHVSHDRWGLQSAQHSTPAPPQEWWTHESQQEFPGMEWPGDESQTLNQAGKPVGSRGVKSLGDPLGVLMPVRGEKKSERERPGSGKAARSSSARGRSMTIDPTGAKRHPSPMVSKSSSRSSVSPIKSEGLGDGDSTASASSSSTHCVSRRQSLSEGLSVSLDRFDAAHDALAIRYNEDVGKLVLKAVEEAQRAEAIRIEDEQIGILANTILEAEQGVRNAEEKLEKCEAQAEVVRMKAENNNRRFEDCFGCAMDSWDGSYEQAKRMLFAVEAARISKAIAVTATERADTSLGEGETPQERLRARARALLVQARVSPGSATFKKPQAPPPPPPPSGSAGEMCM